MKTFKIILKIAAAVLAVILIAGVCIFANALVGNPISKALAENTAKKHVEENYSNKGYELVDISYSFKDGYYHAHFSSPNSIDSGFSLMLDGFGKLRYDNYEYNVTNGWNTANRLRADYRNIVNTIIEGGSFPYNAHMGYGDLTVIAPEDRDIIPNAPEHALVTDELVPDAYYNVNELGSRCGTLTVYIYDETVSAERLAELLLGIRKCFDDSGVGFYTIDCVLEYQQSEDGPYEYGRVEVMNFKYSDIYEEGLIERVTASNDAAQDYYATQDAEKFAEMPIE